MKVTHLPVIRLQAKCTKFVKTFKKFTGLTYFILISICVYHAESGFLGNGSESQLRSKDTPPLPTD